MSFLSRLLLALCIFAGMATGMVHQVTHGSHDDCAAQHSDCHGDPHDTHEDDGEKDAPHHHHCCHAPTAYIALDGVSALTSFQPILVEIPTDAPLTPEEPVFALDKPPLI
jgi:hypothetical protein